MFRSLKTLRSIPRLKDIAFVLGRHGFHQVASAIHAPFTARVRRWFKRDPAHVVEQPERLRMVFEDLGPTFIKFGQLLSTRPDLVPAPYLRELEKLQDDVPPAPFAQIRRILDVEFGGRTNELFASIDEQPIATASIAQVHRAITKRGDEVVIKVRKPGLERVIEQDLVVLGLLVDFLSGWPGMRLFDPEGILRIFERTIRRELDFTYELHNLERLRRQSADDEDVCFPRPYPELSTGCVLTMQYLHGEKLSALQRRSLPRHVGEEAARRLAASFLRQIFEHRVFHGDAHPGNIILMPDGRVGLIDVGNVGRLTVEMSDDLIELLVALVRQDYRSLARWILAQGRPTSEIDSATLAMELMEQLDPYYGLRLEEIRIGDLFNALFGMVFRYGIRVPAQYVTVGRTFVLVESAIRTCAPHLDVLPHIRPYIDRIFRARWSPARLAREAEKQATEILGAMRRFPMSLGEVLERAAEGRIRVENRNPELDRIERRLESAGRRVSLALIVAALILGVAILLQIPETRVSGTLPQILGLFGIFSAALLGVRLLLRGGG
ncbi:MAG TPA: AarF/UbiB family protein [Planctomycetota bacterium]|nr:AarF/UbiB family protein [Planctomycetota bacterium]